MALIYKIQNKVNDKVYIGQTKMSLEWRLNNKWCGHFTRAESSKSSESYIANAIKKYGRDSFTYEVVEERQNDAFESKELLKNWLDSREIYWINFYDSYNTGYNRNLGGHHTISQKGRKMTWSSKIWESRRHNGTTYHTPWNKGKKMSKEYCEAISRARTGTKIKQPRSKEYREKLSNSLNGHAPTLTKHTEETKQKISKAHKGKVLSEEHKKNVGLASRGRKWVNNGIEQTLTKKYQQYIDIGWVYGKIR